MIYSTDVRETLFKRLNNYRQNIQLTIEINPTKLLDSKSSCVKGHPSHIQQGSGSDVLKFSSIITICLFL